jgi:hypothetical protein
MTKPLAPDHARLDRVVAEARQQRELRETGYRERALKLFPWICGRCGREFSGVGLRELTVHHSACTATTMNTRVNWMKRCEAGGLRAWHLQHIIPSPICKLC